MEKPKGYETTEAFTGDFETIKLGGQICRIKEAKIEKTQSQRDMLVLAFDIAEGENEGFYQRTFAKKFETNSQTKWPGVYRILIEDSQGNCSKFFKGFITIIENSNPNFKWDWDEKKLKDKLFGGVFGQEEFELNGEIKLATKCRFVRNVESIRKGVDIPEIKRLNNTSTTEAFIPVPIDDELPF